MNFGYRVTLIVSLCLIQYIQAQNRISLPIPEPLDLDLDYSIVSENELVGKTYQELEALRLDQAQRIEDLVDRQKLRESPKGYLELLTVLEANDLRLMKTENRIRRNMFQRIAALEGRTDVAVAREFYRSQTEEEQLARSLPDLVKPSLSIVMPKGSFGSLGLELAKGFLRSVGYDKISETRGSILIGQRAFGNGYIAVKVFDELPDLEKINHGVVTFESGRVTGEIPDGIIGLEGLAIVVNEANPIGSLSMAQLGNIFSGKTASWSSYRKNSTESISIVLPSQDRSLIDLLRVVLLKPLDIQPSDLVQFPEKDDYLQLVLENPGAISICRVADIPKDLKAIKVRSGSDSLAMTATHENVVSLDYPLIRYLRAKDSGANESSTKDFIRFASQSYGQKIIANAGIGSIEWSVNPDIESADQYRDYLFTNYGTPYSFKSLVKNSVRYKTPVSFRFVPKSSNFQLDHYSQSQLYRLAEFMRKNGANKTVLLLGYADNQGSDSVNLAYSKKRADAVSEKLKGLGLTNIKTAGLGEDLPIGNNNTSNGRAANRRVEVWLSN